MMTTTIAKTSLLSWLTVGPLATGWMAVPLLEGAFAGERAGDATDRIVAQTTPLVPIKKDAAEAIAESAASDTVPKEDTSPNHIGRFDLKHWSPSEEKILEELQENTRLEFNETPLLEVLAFLQDYHEIPIEVDTEALEDEGVDLMSHTITKNLSDIRLRSGLRLILRDLNLMYIIRDDVLMITSLHNAEEYMETRVYKLPDNVSTDDIESLAEVITIVIAPRAWDMLGGPGSIAADNGVLIVSQSQEVHRQLNDFLEQLARADGWHGDRTIQSHRGLTFGEFLVVSAIIATLVVLLISSVKAAREAARKALLSYFGTLRYSGALAALSMILAFVGVNWVRHTHSVSLRPKDFSMFPTPMAPGYEYGWPCVYKRVIPPNVFRETRPACALINVTTACVCTAASAWFCSRFRNRFRMRQYSMVSGLMILTWACITLAIGRYEATKPIHFDMPHNSGRVLSDRGALWLGDAPWEYAAFAVISFGLMCTVASVCQFGVQVIGRARDAFSHSHQE